MTGMMKNRYDDFHMLGSNTEPTQFHSVEFHVDGMKLLYHSKIWNNAAESMFTLIKEDSDILDQIHVGDIMNMKFYPTKQYGPPQDLATEIKYITRDTGGRFKGHYLVGLSIVAN